MQRQGQALVVAVGGGGHQLLGVERVASGTAPDGVDQIGVRGLAADAGELGHGLVAVERTKFEPVDPSPSVELGQVAPEGVPAGGVRRCDR